MKYNLSFLILLFSFIRLALCSEVENSFFNIAQVSGKKRLTRCNTCLSKN